MEKFVLENGLRIVTEVIPTYRSVSFGIWVKTGSRRETEQNRGISHFVEHMLFKGTERYSAKDIADIFDGIGGNVNAFTSKEYTCYHFKVLDQHLPLAMEVLADMFYRSKLDAEEMEREKNVILEEIAMYEDTPDDLVHDLIARAAYGDHPLGYPILGDAKALKSMEPSHLREYMNRHYTADNTVISMAGNIGPEAVELVRRHFGGEGRTGGEAYEASPDFHSGVVFHEKNTEQNHLCLALPGLRVDHENMYGMAILNNLIGGSMSSRLFQEVRENRGLAYSVYSYHSAHIDSGMFIIYVGTAPGQTKEALNVTLDVLEKIRTGEISEAELARGKEQLKGNLILSLESSGSRMNRMGKNELLVGRHYSLDEMIGRIDAVTADDVRNVIGMMFSRPFAVALVGGSDLPIRDFRRDQFVVSGKDQKIAGQ